MLDFDLTVAWRFVQFYENCQTDPTIKMDSKQDPINVRSREIFGDGEWFELASKQYFGSLHSGWTHGHRWGSSAKALLFKRHVIKQWFPSATWVFVLRDPRDVWASLKHAKWSDQTWKDTVNGFAATYCTYLTALDDKTICVVRYEDVVDDPGILAKLVGVPKAENPLFGTGEIFQNRSLPRPIKIGKDGMVERRNRWKTELTDGESQSISSICKLVFDEGYYTI